MAGDNDPDQPSAKRSRFDTSNGQAASSTAPTEAVPVKPVSAAGAKAVLERARAAMERKKALDAKLKASKVRGGPNLPANPDVHTCLIFRRCNCRAALRVVTMV